MRNIELRDIDTRRFAMAPAVNARSLNSWTSIIGFSTRCLDIAEGGEHADSRDHEQDVRRLPSPQSAQREADEEARETYPEQDVPEWVQLLVLLSLQVRIQILELEVGPDRRKDAGGEVYPEDRPPPEEGREDPSRDQAEDGPRDARHLVDPQRPAPLRRRGRRL